MSKHASYVPQHRSAPGRTSRRTAPRLVRGAMMMSGLAVAATGMSVSGGVLTASSVGAGLSEAGGLVASTATGRREQISTADITDRQVEQVSRSDRRRPDSAGQAVKAAALSTDQGQAKSRTESLSDADPREIGRALLADYGFAADQFACLDSLYVSESDWRVDADNPISSAYGIPQALTSMHELPADYLTSAESQIRWGLEYISNSYGTPCSAWGFKQGHGWY